MKRKTILLSALLLFLLCLLLLFPMLSLEGVKSGLILWGLTLVPVLFPFFLVTGLMKIFFPASDTPFFYVALGILSGYPVGASLLSTSENPKIRSDFYLGLISNPSPAFLLTFVAGHTLSLGSKKIYFYLLILISSLLGNLIANHFLSPVYPVPCKSKILEKKNVSPTRAKTEETQISIILDNVLWGSIVTLLKIGGYVMLFSIIARFLLLIPIKSEFVHIILSGVFELTTGISLLGNSSLMTTQKIVPAALLCSFGGLCSVLQIQSVIGGSGLSIFNYMIRKLLSSVVAVILAFVFFR